MSLIEELKESLEAIDEKVKGQQTLEKDDLEILFLKSLIEEETGHGNSRE